MLNTESWSFYIVCFTFAYSVRLLYLSLCSSSASTRVFRYFPSSPSSPLFSPFYFEIFLYFPSHKKIFVIPDFIILKVHIQFFVLIRNFGNLIFKAFILLLYG